MDVKTDDDILFQLGHLKSGESLVYHVGQLAYDREGTSPYHIRLNKIADAAYKGAQRGDLCLTQRKFFHDPTNRGLNSYEYIAVGCR